jgi:hypothetical protein
MAMMMQEQIQNRNDSFPDAFRMMGGHRPDPEPYSGPPLILRWQWTNNGATLVVCPVAEAPAAAATAATAAAAPEVLDLDLEVARRYEDEYDAYDVYPTHDQYDFETGADDNDDKSEGSYYEDYDERWEEDYDY